ncbi:MAG: discoidin domain-containing protein [Paenibacillus sp.]|nr:discoidin domain-containing protein [Paenibacillus sp.]
MSDVKVPYFKKSLMRILSTVVSISIIATILPLSIRVSAAETTEPLMMMDFLPTINEVIDESGFKHPGVGPTKDTLENMRNQVLAQKEPWITYYNEMLKSSSASKTVSSSNQSGTDPTKPGSDAFNSQSFNSRFIADGLKAYTQSILFYVTGEETYRSNAMHIIRIWSQMDPAKYMYFNDAHIHTGIPLNRMVSAAEILRYTSSRTEELKWTDKDTTDFTTNLITPVIETFQHDNNYFMNQHQYPLLGAMAGYIFTGNRARYNEGVEWFTVNKTAVDQGQNGAIKPLFRLVDTNILTGEAVDPPRVQHVEMGRDQAHGAGDITNAEILSRLLLAQGTKVDPIVGTVSTAANAVNPYEFLNDRILKAADYFAQFMIGHDTPWTPVAAHTDVNGNPTIIYKELSEQYRGRLTQNVWELFYYYKYTAGINIEEIAPYFTQMFAKRVSYNWDGVDGGGDFWLFIPKAAEVEGTKYLVKPIVDPLREIEDRYTAFDSNSTVKQEGDTSFVEFLATEEGSEIALIGSGTSEKNIGFRIRTHGVAKLEMSYSINDTLTLPDTKGQWKYVTYTMGNFQGLGDLAYLKVKGNGTTVDIDHINIKAGVQLTPPVFNAGKAALNLFTYVGSEATIHYDFSATDSNATDVVTYQVDNLPEGAVINESTGVFSWSPSQAGTYSFVVGASDGTSVSTKDVIIVVTNDRQSAIDAAIAPYNANTIYIQSTLDRYKQVYDDAMNLISSASDEVFYQQLSDLSSAVQSLQELTPLLKDGSMNYANMFVASTIGNGVPNLLDNYAGSFAVYTSAKNLTHTMDFGPSFKVSANAFELQVRASFPERIGGVTLFGSNDGTTWIRLTPDTTKVNEDMQRLEVEEGLENEQFRFLKMQMIEPSSTMLEVAEFRIFGERYETINKITSVSISSDQSLKNRIVPGNTIKLSFKSTEKINAVNVSIQGQNAIIKSDDNLNWTAELVVDRSVPIGTVKFSIHYKTASGIDGSETIFTTDGSTLFIADESDLISNVLNMTTLSDSNGRTQADLLATASALFDNNLGSVTDFRLNGSGYGGYITFDMKEGNMATLSKVELIARQDNYYNRINGTVVQGSNDNSTWTTISTAAASTTDWQTLSINSTVPYRYIRMYNAGNWYGNIAELRLHGNVKVLAKLSSVSISSDQSLRKRIVTGNTVKLSFQSIEPINTVKVRIQGQDAIVNTVDNMNWTAHAIMDESVSVGTVKFSINYKTADGSDAPLKSSTTDNSTLFIADVTGLISNITSLTNLIDSSTGRTASVTLQNANNIFDSNLGSISDFRNGTSGSGASITFDFKVDNQVVLSRVDLLARQDNYYTRINGTVVQGSNDNSTWTTISTPAASTAEWQTLSINSKVPYRYVRIYNGNSWFGNMAELRLYAEAADVTPPVTTDDAPQGWVNQDSIIHFQANDTESGVASTYFTLNGGVQQTGNTVTLSTDGVHTLVYWSVDVAGNVESAKTVNINLDTIGPQISVTGIVYGNFSDASDIVPVVTLEDNLSGVDNSKIKVTLEGTQYQLGETIQLYKLPLGTHTFIVNVSDLAGNITSETVAFNTFASIEGLEQLVARFTANQSIDNTGVSNSLQMKLEQNDLPSFIQEVEMNLNSFIHEVEAQSGKHIDAESAAYLLRDARALLL